ncbi:MAG: hypothetical protein AAF667_00680 [Pseudomonadota bacterium]
MTQSVLPEVPKTARDLPEAGASSVTISMKCGLDKALTVQSVEMSQKGSRTRCMFSERNRPEEVLSRGLCEQVTKFLEEGTQTRITSYPDHQLELPGLTLRKARVLITRAEDGDSFIMVRFAVCYGNVISLFSEEMRPWQAGHDQAQLIAAETLERIFIPLMNLADHISLDIDNIRDASTARISHSLDQTRQRIDELEIYYNMLVDFVAKNQDVPERHTHLAISSVGNGT